MTKETELDRIIEVKELKMLVNQLQTEVKELKEWKKYCDKLALKWGGACLGILVVGAILGGHFEKIRKLIMESIL